MISRQEGALVWNKHTRLCLPEPCGIPPCADMTASLSGALLPTPLRLPRGNPTAGFSGYFHVRDEAHCCPAGTPGVGSRPVSPVKALGAPSRAGRGGSLSICGREAPVSLHRRCLRPDLGSRFTRRSNAADSLQNPRQVLSSVLQGYEPLPRKVTKMKQCF